MVFVDTGAWFAVHVPSDPNHARANAWFDANTEPLLTTDYCVDETLTLLIARKRGQRAIEAGSAFFEQDVAHIHFLTPDQIRRPWVLFQQRVATGWSFTDCTSKEIGVMRTDLLPGRYSVQFGLGSRKHWIELNADTEFVEPPPDPMTRKAM